MAPAQSETQSRAAQLKATLAGPGGPAGHQKPQSGSTNARRNKTRTNNYLSKVVDRKQNSSVNVNQRTGRGNKQRPEEDKDY